MSANGYGSVYHEDDNKLKWIYNLAENTSQETIILQPGRYRVVFRTKYTNRSSYTVEKSFKVTSGTSVTVNLFQN